MCFAMFVAAAMPDSMLGAIAFVVMSHVGNIAIVLECPPKQSAICKHSIASLLQFPSAPALSTWLPMLLPIAMPRLSMAQTGFGSNVAGAKLVAQTSAPGTK